MSLIERNIELVQDVFRAVEDEDTNRFRDLCHPECEFYWPPSLPYGGVRRASDPDDEIASSWARTWRPLQPSKSETRLSPRVVAANEREVVAPSVQRGLAPDGEGIESPVLGLYQVREGKLAHARMFYFDPVAVGAFLERAAHQMASNQRRPAS